MCASEQKNTFLSFETKKKDLEDECFELYVTNVKINNLLDLITAVETVVCDMSWIETLSKDVIKCYESSASETVKTIHEILGNKRKILNGYLDEYTDKEKEEFEEKIRTDFGEYAVSYCAIMALESEFNHQKLPLAEIFKESKGSNPGFDFHTIKDKKYVVFGESKYDKSGSGKKNSLAQINKFIKKGKHYRDLVHLIHMAPSKAVLNLNDNAFYVAAAYTSNTEEIEITAENIVISKNILKIIKSDALGLYIIAINEGETF